MRNNFSPSINIIRDQDKDFEYITTPNSERVIENLNKNVSRGIKAFYLVGSFGTGKSSFLLAFEKQLSTGKKIFNTPITFNGKTKYEALNIVGDFRSMEDAVRNALGVSSKKDLFNELNKYYKKIHASKRGLLIAIDEFGKFLEHASQNNPEKELYLIQQLAEFANDHNKKILFLTTLHQGFDVYRKNIDDKLKNEWEKVKGRLKEISFNEPVEQLLHLAAKYLNGNPKGINKEEFRKLYKSILNARVYPLNNSIDETLAKQLFPLDLLSAGILTKALQKYGQNERSLFTFLETTDFNNVDFTENKFFNLNSVYDYLIDNYYSLLSSKYNPHYLKWSIIRNSLDRNEIIFEKEAKSKEKLIKAIGLLNIFAPSGAKIDEQFLKIYGKSSLELANIKKDLFLLKEKNIIRYRNYSESYVLFEGTDIDMDLALSEAENYINPNPDVAIRLKEYFDFPYLPAKASYIKKGTPRFFEFIISDQPVNINPVGDVDGIINLIFNEGIEIKQLKSISKESNEAILYAVYNSAERIKETIKEIDKVNYVLENTVEDHVVQREMKNLKDSLVSELNELVMESLFKANSEIIWIYNGNIQKINSRFEFNKLLSKIIDKVYPSVPVFHNELINREKLPGAISKARKLLLQNLINKWDKKDLGFDVEKFPPEKTIYLSLLKTTGIHRLKNNEYILTEPSEVSFKPLWKSCEKFFNSCKASKKSILELVEILADKPFKLKKGLIDVWIPIYLFIKRNDFALFDKDTFVPNLSTDLFDLIIKYPQNYYIKAFDIQGIKFDLFNRYRTLINKTKRDKITVNSFIETIRPFLSLYNNLPAYTQKTNRLSKNTAVFREVIKNAKDPEKTFFEDFPAALGYSTIKLYESDKYLSEFVNKLQISIRELRTGFDELINRIEVYLLNELGIEKIKYPKYKDIISQRFSTIKKHLLLPHQKTFYIRLFSELDERNAWISSIVHSLIGKNLENITDDEEELIYEKLSDLIKEFDTLCEFANLEVDESKEVAVKLEISSTNNSLQKSIIRLPKTKIKKHKKLETEISNLLTKDKTINQMVLLKLLKDQLGNE
ncbi:MAG: hypothetical protein IH949_05775 [Bacteroidetes bacterium]|nr:hypothetical protein [Bacteroidota bacterium]